jgi:hypothetical protein
VLTSRREDDEEGIDDGKAILALVAQLSHVLLQHSNFCRI